MSDSKHKPGILSRHRELLHDPRADLHEKNDLHPHHHKADHVRHHHGQHMLHHHGKETLEERTFIDRENHLHRLEKGKELSEDNVARKEMKTQEKASGTPGEKKRRRKHKSSDIDAAMERLGSLRLRVAHARAAARERGERTF